MSNPCKTGSPSGRCNTGSGSGVSLPNGPAVLLVDASGNPLVFAANTHAIPFGSSGYLTQEPNDPHVSRPAFRYQNPSRSDYDLDTSSKDRGIIQSMAVGTGAGDYIGEFAVDRAHNSGQSKFGYRRRTNFEISDGILKATEVEHIVPESAHQYIYGKGNLRITASDHVYFNQSQLWSGDPLDPGRRYLPPYDRPICLGAGHTDLDTWHGALTIGGTTAPVAGTLYAYPIMSGNKNSISGIMCNCVTGTSGNVRLGLYSNHDSTNRRVYPGSRIVDSGDISTATAGNKIAVISPAITLLPYAIYWLVAQFSAAPSVREWGTCSDYHGGNPMGHNSVEAPNQTRTYVTHSGTYGPLPATFPATSPGFLAGGIALAWRVGLV